jgi:hypothetical protein
MSLTFGVAGKGGPPIVPFVPTEFAPDPVGDAEIWEAALAFAQYMREHGLEVDTEVRST